MRIRLAIPGTMYALQPDMSLRRPLPFLSSATLGALILAFSPFLGGVDSAHADGYVGIGVGSGAELGGELSDFFITDEDSSSSRILVGKRFGSLAIEASLFGSQLYGNAGDFATVSLGLDAKYYLGLAGGLEGYGKIGLNKTWLTGPEETEEWDYKGRGQELGLGLQYNFSLALTDIGVWLDYTIQNTELRDGENQVLDGTLEMVNLGLSVGF